MSATAAPLPGPRVALDARLAQDCRWLGGFAYSELLLRDVAALPWFILVPPTACTELYQLTVADQLQLMREINLLSRCLKAEFGVTRINVAAIGNIVPQLHVHVVGRTPGDPCWPSVVWGASFADGYSASEVGAVRARVARHCQDAFTAGAGHG